MLFFLKWNQNQKNLFAINGGQLCLDHLKIQAN